MRHFALCTGPASRAQVTRGSFFNVCQKADILHQRRWWIVTASTFEGKCFHRREQNHFLRHVCKIWSWFDEPHSTSSRSKGLSPEVVSLSEDSLLATCANKLGMLWLDMPLPDLFSGCFRTKPPPLCFKFISTPHQSQQWQHARWFVGVAPLNSFLLSSRKVSPCLTDRTTPLVYQFLNGRRQPGGT